MKSLRRLSRRSALSAATLALLAPTLAGGGPLEPGDDASITRSSSEAAAAGHVVAISLDGFNPKALKKLGKARTPVLHRLLRQGASTRNARAQVELTITLPNHTSMITSRRIDPAKAGHGVTWNHDASGKDIQEASHDPDISSVFKVVHDHGGSTALFSTKTKFSLFQRSWPAAVDREVIREERDARLVELFNADLVDNRRTFSFLHLGRADQIGHAKRWMSKPYLRAIRKLDSLVGSVVSTIRKDPELSASTVVVLTADHGGRPGTKGHSARKQYDNYRIPFLIWGPGVSAGDLYDLNPQSRQDPGTGRPTGSSPIQPVRNGELGNVSLDLLGMPPIPDSLWNAAQDLAWTN